jgi:hypothetical protein
MNIVRIYCLMGSMIDTSLDNNPNDAKYIEAHRCGSIPSLLDTRPLNTQPPSLPDDFDKHEFIQVVSLG